ncbi:hypothetical protein DFQ30_000965, partial [Apophysomyces sp. BC1015]
RPLQRQLQHFLLEEPQQHPPINDLSDMLNQSLYQALDNSIGTKATPPKSAKWFWTPALQDAVNRREHCYRKWRRAAGTAKISWWIAHQEARARLRLAVRARRNTTWRNFCDRMATRNFPAATAKLSKIRRGRTIQPTFTHTDGAQVAADTMKSHLKRVFD